MSIATTLDPRRDEDLVTRTLLERRALATPQRRFVTFPAEGIEWTWQEADRVANRAAHRFAGLGLAKGGVIAALAPNGTIVFETVLGAAKLGALVCPLNPELRGPLLQHALTVTQASVVWCDSVERAAAVRELDLPITLFCGDDTEPVDERDHDTAPPDPGIHFWDPYAIVMTSGTTGPSKGVLSSYAHLFATIEHAMLPYVDEHDVLLCDVPMFHVSGLINFASALQRGASLVVLPRVDAEGYWARLREHAITHATFLPSVAQRLAVAPPRTTDRDHSARTALCGPAWTGWPTFFERFGIERAYSFFNMTEISSPLVRAPGQGSHASCGKPRPGVDVRIVDEHDVEVPVGAVGELTVRTARAWEMNSGYVNMPEATAAAWRNGWFHTGDLFRRDEHDNYFYVDRRKDAVRRNGENISSFEVETEISTFPAVAECAVVAVVDERVGEEVHAVVVARAGESIDPAALIEHLRPRLPRFMLPRYVTVTELLPRNASGKVQKQVVRDRGLSADTWDRRNAG